MAIDLNDQYNFTAFLDEHHLEVRPASIETLWVNVTRLCNQECSHCHVDASPARTEQMRRYEIDRCLEVLSQHDRITTLDLTGGAPELLPDLDYFVVEARKLGKRVIIRHNLTVIIDGNRRTGEKKDHLPEFYAEQRVELIASLPHYRKEDADKQRGNGVFRKSVEGIRLLNKVGYGRGETGLILNLVHNCNGPITREERNNLENNYRQELYSGYGLFFNKLLTVTNMPINRFHAKLLKTGMYADYMKRLVAAFHPEAVSGLVCRSLISVGYDGRLFDCDFNQMLEMQVYDNEPMTVDNFSYDRLLNRKIKFGPHCFGCTAGGGSS
ncbi:MAG: radical SAM protein [Chloroflexi bacterium RBG_16_50_9]|nr:MAG: radical SAM protein [Chloroflexi bacterium RBG_16_50_9]